MDMRVENLRSSTRPEFGSPIPTRFFSHTYLLDMIFSSAGTDLGWHFSIFSHNLVNGVLYNIRFIINI